MEGALYVCGTPIGNLEDISLRALRVLREADLVAAEDTRHTLKLLNRYEIRVPLISYHEHNKFQRQEELLDRVRGGAKVVLVSDAGMPGISDPGHELVAAVLEAGLNVIPVPGPSAALTALVISGLPTDRFLFLGFAGRRRAERKRELEGLRSFTGTMVFYEAPHRIRELLEDILELLGDRPASLSRELTKVHEETLRLPVSGLLEHFQSHEARGEFTLVLAGASAEEEGEEKEDIDDVLRELSGSGLSKPDIARQAARRTGLPRQEIYKRLSQDG